MPRLFRLIARQLGMRHAYTVAGRRMQSDPELVSTANRAKYRGESQKWVKNTGDIVNKCQFHKDF